MSSVLVVWRLLAPGARWHQPGPATMAREIRKVAAARGDGAACALGDKEQTPRLQALLVAVEVKRACASNDQPDDINLVIDVRSYTVTIAKMQHIKIEVCADERPDGSGCLARAGSGSESGQIDDLGLRGIHALTPWVERSSLLQWPSAL